MNEVRALAKSRRSMKKTTPVVTFAKHFLHTALYIPSTELSIENVIAPLKDLGVPNPDNIVKAIPMSFQVMQQRIVIAIALAWPSAFIADEPTSNLDVTIQAQILELIRELKKTKISSVLFITHDLGVVAEICDRVSVMYAGDVRDSCGGDIFHEPLHPYTKGPPIQFQR